MNTSEMFRLKKLVYSFEVFPPKKTTSIDTIYHTLKGLPSLNPDFISVTYGAGGSAVQKNKTSEIASLIKSEYKIEPVSHLTCVGCEQEDIRAFLDHLKASGVENILALRGDETAGMAASQSFRHACDLMQYIREYDPSINILGACYPEGHCDAPDLNTDIQYLKYKLEAGATHLISQLFFSNKHYYDFINRIDQAGIRIPISAGIMPIVSKSQIERVVTMCGASLPVRFSRMISKYADDAASLKAAGLDFAINQIYDLVGNGIRGIHLYTMNSVENATFITESISDLRE